jgi:hypothetical protein
LKLVDFLGNSEQILDVVADLVGDHIRLGKIPRSAKPLGHVLEEGDIEV